MEFGVSGTLIVLVVLVALAILTAFKGIRTVPQGESWTVERFGAFTHTLQPGLNFIIPYIDTIGRRVNVQETVLDIPEQAVITRDNANVSVDGVVYYRVMDPAKAAYQVQNLTQALTALAMTNIRAIIGEMDLDAALSSRDKINTHLLSVLDGATDPWGAKVTRVEIRKIEPPANLVAAMNTQMTAERERRAMVARAQGEREAAIARAEGEKAAQVLEAEGRLEAARRDAEARERLAQAEAEATRSVAAAARDGGDAALGYFIAERYIQAFGQLAANPSSKLVVVPMEASALAGGITGAVELFRNAGGAGPVVPPVGGAPLVSRRPGSVPEAGRGA
ncbi:SPFH domain-containing protein [Pseudoroseomonas cervicalis]|uniref:SPFH domain-containing protein n=1 Tax=Teichococcus cervicalis TaxID=204525 RepID=UPI002783B78E|nr:SPFH domain-containing protein [Pseudoroseomonas cervicalis]MDQ1081389.1 regulator of protease activity HflC (stomatin/prohibitin superfamily) [Pseudoroseomonas cervicalis]